MTERTTPVDKITLDGRAGRRRTDPVLATPDAPAPDAGSNLPVVVPAAPKEETATSQFEAQLLGQDGQKRGLRGGEPVLNQAKSAYLSAEYSGKADRRPSKGVIRKNEI